MNSECQRGVIPENEPRPSSADVLEALRFLHMKNRKPVQFDALFDHMKGVLPIQEWSSEDNALDTPETVLTKVIHVFCSSLKYLLICLLYSPYAISNET